MSVVKLNAVMLVVITPRVVNIPKLRIYIHLNIYIETFTIGNETSLYKPVVYKFELNSTDVKNNTYTLRLVITLLNILSSKLLLQSPFLV
jgi:hypothetical protein